MSVLDALYAEGGDDAILHTVEFQCEAWSEPIVLVRDYVDHTITTEDNRTLIALASGMDVALPKRDNTGAQRLVFAIDGVNMEALIAVREALTAQKQINLIYRCYLASDLSEPAESPFNFVVHSCQITNTRVDVTAGLFDFINYKWPRDIFNDKTAPALKFLQ